MRKVFEPGTTNVVKVETDDNNKFCSLAFKLWTDVFAGKLVFLPGLFRSVEKGRHDLQSAHAQT